MLSIQQVKDILNDSKLSEEEILQIRDDFRLLAEIIFEKWQSENKTNQQLNKIICDQYKEDFGKTKNKTPVGAL